MKNIIVITVFSLLLLNTSKAQTTSTFNRSDLEYSSDGIIYLTKTDSVLGKIQFQAYDSKSVSIVTSDGKLTVHQAKNTYGFRLININKVFISVTSQGLGSAKLFYEDITPNGGKRLLLLKSFVKSNVNLSATVVEGKYETDIYSPSDSQILSGFKKVSAYVKDCAALAEKINKKEKGYYHGLMSTPFVQNEVNERIVSDYNNCK